eukprot:TRINITY_DN84422_c0_g1_i1.p1 TRINITY_DN84422_c0_g1~~TRINITY_DN84422_c0_g1_i1.p1  ORF type:complete len:581 (+),score=327.97 TRINITY_DN84422_c0_g1_i1:57-1799(+)
MSDRVKWVIKIKTADTTSAGISNAPVYLKIHGTLATCKPIQLGRKNSRRYKGKKIRNPFTRNFTSVFHALTKPVGDVISVDVWHGAGDKSWGLDFIELQLGFDSWMFRLNNVIRGGGGKATLTNPEHTMVTNGANRLHLAAKKGDIELMETIINAGELGINDRDLMGRQPVHYAVLYGQPQALDVLLEYQVDLASRDHSGRTPLHLACVNHLHNIDIIKRLLQNAPPVRSSDAAPHVLDHKADNDDDEFNHKEDKNVEAYILLQDKFGKSALHYAAAHGFAEVIQLLHKQCSFAISAPDTTLQTPLHAAAIQGETKAALCLIDLGADVARQDRMKKTFLHHAATAGHFELISRVLRYGFSGSKHEQIMALLETRDQNGRTPLLCAADAGSLECVETLEQLGADMHAVDAEQSNALHLACRYGDGELLAYLAQQHDVNKTNAYLCTPLHIAVHCNNSKAVAWLIKNKCALDAINIAGETAMAVAQDRGFDTMERALVNAKAMTVDLGKTPDRSDDFEAASSSPSGRSSGGSKLMGNSKKSVAFSSGNDLASLQREVARLRQEVARKDALIAQFHSQTSSDL